MQAPRGGRKLTVLDIPDTEGSVMPQPDEILSATQKDGTKLKAAEIYERVWNWLDNLVVERVAYFNSRLRVGGDCKTAQKRECRLQHNA